MEQNTRVSRYTATIINMNAMIGAGIFSLPLALLGSTGPAGIITLLGVICGVWLLGQALAHVAARMPAGGSLYAYTASWGGPRVGLVALVLYTTGVILAMGLLTSMVGAYLAELTVGLNLPISSTVWSGISLGTIAATIIWGGAISTWGQRMLLVATVSPIISTSILCLTHPHPSYLVPFAPYGLLPIITSVKAVIFGFFGLECATSLAAHVKNPARDVPQAVTWSVIAVGGLYTLFLGAITLAVPLTTLTGSSTITGALLDQFPHHPWLLTGVACAIISATLGTIHSMLWSASALLASAAQFTYPASQVTPRAATLILIGAIFFVSRFLVTNLDLFFSITAVCVVTTYTLALGNLFFTKPTLSPTWQSTAYGGLITACIIMILAWEGVIRALLSYRG